jgi:hypothetical protein
MRCSEPQETSNIPMSKLDLLSCEGSSLASTPDRILSLNEIKTLNSIGWFFHKIGGISGKGNHYANSRYIGGRSYGNLKVIL